MNTVALELTSIVDLVEPMLQEIATEPIAVRSHPEKWSRKEILGHLIDSACNNQQKFVRMMEQPHLEFPGYHQDEWVAIQNWAEANWTDMVQLWSSYNRHLAYMMENIDAKFLTHTIVIEEAGPFTLEFIMPDYVEHLKHHLLQIFPDINLESKFKNVYGV